MTPIEFINTLDELIKNRVRQKEKYCGILEDCKLDEECDDIKETLTNYISSIDKTTH
jgi:hypothetical protein